MFALPSRIACAVVGALFLLFAALQYNDPDPIQWIVIYAAAALSCLLAAIRARVDFRLPSAVALAAAIWAALLLPQTWGAKSFIDNLRLGEGMRDPVTEVSRELGGLSVVAAVMIPLAIAAYRARAFRNRV